MPPNTVEPFSLPPRLHSGPTVDCVRLLFDTTDCFCGLRALQLLRPLVTRACHTPAGAETGEGEDAVSPAAIGSAVLAEPQAWRLLAHYLTIFEESSPVLESLMRHSMAVNALASKICPGRRFIDRPPRVFHPHAPPAGANVEATRSGGLALWSNSKSVAASSGNGMSGSSSASAGAVASASGVSASGTGLVISPINAQQP